MVLEKEGYFVRALTSPERALEELRSSAYHLVVLDLMMPGMGGLELLREIRSRDEDIAVIIFTGYPSVDSAIESLQLRASDYVKKPFRVEDLKAIVRRTLERKGLVLDPETELHQTIGATIREIRKEKGLTLKQVARRTGLSVSLLSQIERAESSASISSLYRIACALQVRLTEIFGDY
ncbi:MAG: response regulator [Deltaproteobacteria bacterium]|nr:MAG: response regulator [Deltaproteobacteria bacterium]